MTDIERKPITRRAISIKPNIVTLKGLNKLAMPVSSNNAKYLCNNGIVRFEENNKDYLMVKGVCTNNHMMIIDMVANELHNAIKNKTISEEKVSKYRFNHINQAENIHNYTVQMEDTNELIQIHLDNGMIKAICQKPNTKGEDIGAWFEETSNLEITTRYHIILRKKLSNGKYGPGKWSQIERLITSRPFDVEITEVDYRGKRTFEYTVTLNTSAMGCFIINNVANWGIKMVKPKFYSLPGTAQNILRRIMNDTKSHTFLQTTLKDYAGILDENNNTKIRNRIKYSLDQLKEAGLINDYTCCKGEREYKFEIEKIVQSEGDLYCL